MSFPLMVGARKIADPPALAELARADSGPESGTVIPGKRPAEWIFELVGTGVLPRRMAIALGAALIQYPEPGPICEGARLAHALGDNALGTLILRALEAHDTAVLLASDPADPSGSVEDALVRAAAASCDLEDPALRRSLLEKARNAGLYEVEIPVLATRGSIEELALWLPAVLAEPLAASDLALLGARAAHDDDAGHLVAGLLRDRRPI
jgi:hypothetical protein